MCLCICAFVYLCNCAIAYLCNCAFVYLCIFVLVYLCFIGGGLSPDKEEYQSAFVYLCICAFVHLCICVIGHLCICVFVYFCISVFVFISAAGCLLTRRNIGGVQQGDRLPLLQSNSRLSNGNYLLK